MTDTTSGQPLITGRRLLAAALVLNLSNFIVILDATIANVSLAHISGSLAVSPSQGTWVITSYAVAEAICVPLTGWLSGRFGAVRTFASCIIGFGLFSLLCGMSTSLAMLVICRIGQGASGGPLLALSQTLLMRIYPREQLGKAMAMWGATIVVAPVTGPLLGGAISDNWSWHWIFLINVPITLICGIAAMRLMKPAETPTVKLPIDRVGLTLLVVWIGALQLMLDLGRERDWFNDSLIVCLGLVALVGFAVFLVWELTESSPIVDLRAFRHRGYGLGVAALSVSFATYFTIQVIVAQWMQIGLGYTATQAGYALAMGGATSFILSPFIGKLSNKLDRRIIVCAGFTLFCSVAFVRSHATTDMGFWSIALPQTFQSASVALFYVPLTTIILASLPPREIASAAGLMSFMRTAASAVATAYLTSVWDDQTRIARSEMVTAIKPDNVTNTFASTGMSIEQARATLERLVNNEALIIGLNHVFLLAMVALALSALAVWFVPRMKAAR